MQSIDLNCDMGESFGSYTLGVDNEVFPYITSANIACGWHAGDPLVMKKTVEAAKIHGVSVGAHPGYPDLMGFGRRSMNLKSHEITAYVQYQVGALQAFCRAYDSDLKHVKPHGALYLDAMRNEEIAEAIAGAVHAMGSEIILVVLAGNGGEIMRKAGKALGLRMASEAFPDRAYTPQGTLLPRTQPGAVITDIEKVVERAATMAQGTVTAIDGTRIIIDAQTLCIHGDNAHAGTLVRRIRTEFESLGIMTTPLSCVV